MNTQELEKIKQDNASMIKSMMKKYSSIDNEEELNQLVCIAIWRAKEKYNNTKSTFANYLRYSIRWHFLSHHRKQKKAVRGRAVRRTHNQTDIELVDLTDCLAASERDLFCLRFVDRLTIQEISSRLELSPGKIKKEICKIKHKIKLDMTVL